MNDLQEKIKKLPQWAQRHIARLERDVAGLKAERQSVEAGATKVHWRTGLDVGVHLPDRAKVAFDTDGGELECRLHDGKLVVSGDCTLYIRPVVSNVIEVRAGE